MSKQYSMGLALRFFLAHFYRLLHTKNLLIGVYDPADKVKNQPPLTGRYSQTQVLKHGP